MLVGSWRGCCSLQTRTSRSLDTHASRVTCYVNGMDTLRRSSEARSSRADGALSSCCAQQGVPLYELQLCAHIVSLRALLPLYALQL